jgi:hypothetical protein
MHHGIQCPIYNDFMSLKRLVRSECWKGCIISCVLSIIYFHRSCYHHEIMISKYQIGQYMD